MRTRTSISIDPHVHHDAERLAKKRGLTVSSLVQEALVEYIARATKPAKRDSLFTRIPVPAGVKGSADLSERHDEYVARRARS